MGRKKTVVIDDDEYSIDTGLSENPKIHENDVGINEKMGPPGMPTVAVDKHHDDVKKIGKIATATNACGPEDVTEIVFTGKKKSSKKKMKNSVSVDLMGGDKEKVGDAELDVGKETTSEVAGESIKSKVTKKEKDEKGAQDNEDLDKKEEVHCQHESVPALEAVGEEDEDGKELVAVKKKKKKKTKEEKKLTLETATTISNASEVKEEMLEEAKSKPVESKKPAAKGKVTEKKVPRHVREMQEALARRKEYEEKQAREEEERRRKEEEEIRRQEELEKKAEEAKRLRKQREKEKLLKKKLEGKLLTGKQKEEKKRLEAMRNQFLANSGMIVSAAENGVQTKRPIYAKKARASHHHASKPSSASEETGELEHVKDNLFKQKSMELENGDAESENVEEQAINEVYDGVEEEEEKKKEEEEDDDEDDEWDAKSWDDVNLIVKGAFDDEIDSEPEPVVTKEIKVILPPSNTRAAMPAAKNHAPTHQMKSQIAEKEKGHNEDHAASKKEGPVLNDSTKQFEEVLRSPICCIMGHVDTGKTKLLDFIRGTNVQEGEAGGITQQIGATYFTTEHIRERTRELKADATLKVPGLLVIDTPGHESFTNLRSRGSSLCDIAILVVDIMHGLEPQTIESLNLLKMKNTEFIVALNKVDRIYGWKVCRNMPIVMALKQQSKDVKDDFNRLLVQIVTQFKEQGLNTELYYKNREMGETYSIVPTSAISGEGIPDLLLLLVQWAQRTMTKKLTFSNEIQCTVLEVKVVEGHGTTIDVVLVNGVLHEGDQIVVCGLQGPILTSIRALLTPHPMRELRVKGTYLHHKEIKAAQGIKIAAQGLEHAIAGTGLYIVGPNDDVDDVKESAMEDMKSVMGRIDKSGEGVYVQASTLGSLEALLEFLKSPAVKIPVSGIGIGPVHKKDVVKASVMLEKKKEYATILAFDVKITSEAKELADELGINVFVADIIYHLFDQFTNYIAHLREEKKRQSAGEVVFPCVLAPRFVFNKKYPIVLGVDILAGIVKVGTPVCIPSKDFIDIGRISSIERDHKSVEKALKGDTVAIKIVGENPEQQHRMFGRHFDLGDELVSHMSSRSLEVLEANFWQDLSDDEKKLALKLKKLFSIF